MEIFTERLEKALKNKKVSQKDLAEFICIRRPTISDWKKNGSIPAGDICIKIADYLGVDVRWLVLGEESDHVTLTPEEKKLLAAWEELSAQDKEEIQMLIDFKSKAAKAKSVQADLA